ncbi:hypothetical protein [Alkalitalea saponilacus]|uniref:Uncharacterized protein n=1 Tax=Alkalitalea saponilacus TaxID=889453 RepID=A0A1T5HUB0_9BACT|nr:hypothetical protein [Alkalitalea saponilacus]ASB50328.1 hypothetical protein CDL62_14850 [Alkalitalea saponilacus]SKC24262.1 hypothetical protein SAMN03080601_03559 [Alkalitalea saponilacus]
MTLLNNTYNTKSDFNRKLVRILCFALFLSNSIYLTGNQPAYVIHDTISVNEKYYESYKFELVNFPILFLGILKDTVIIDHKLFLYPIPPPPPPTIVEWLTIEDDQNSQVIEIDSIQQKKLFDEFMIEYRNHPLEKFRKSFGYSHNKKTIHKEKSVSVKVDTINEISKYNLHHKEYYKAFPIIISNNLNDTILMDSNTNISLIVEALDSLNNWRRITSPNIHGIPIDSNYFLPPKFSVILSTYITRGDYQTKLRIRVGNNYSNEWTGKINYSQFSLFVD